MDLASVTPGMRVRIEQTILCRDRVWIHELVGMVQAVKREPTGSWYAHGRNGRLWLDRIELRKHDGELTKVCLDDRTRITLLPSTGASDAA
ncbi:MAG: hypothetical protein V2A79_17675 [Planctomycetota bacterium]